MARTVLETSGGSDPLAEFNQVKQAMANWQSEFQHGTLDLEKMVRERLSAIVKAAKPEWAKAIDATGASIDQVLANLEAVAGIEQNLQSLDEAILQLSGSPIDQVAAQLQRLSDNVDDSMGAFRAALTSGDLTAVRDTIYAAQQAVIERYQAEIQLAEQLKAKVEEIKRAAEAVRLEFQSRIDALETSLGGGPTLTSFYDRGNALIGEYLSTSDPNARLGLIRQGMALVDEGLAFALRSVDQWLAQQQAALRAATEAQLRAIDAQVRGLEAQKRQIQETYQKSREALEEQLRLAQQWNSVLEGAKRLIEQMTYTRASPLPTSARLDIAGAEVERLRAEFDTATGEDRPRLAQELLARLSRAGYLILLQAFGAKCFLGSHHVYTNGS